MTLRKHICVHRSARTIAAGFELSNDVRSNGALSSNKGRTRPLGLCNISTHALLFITLLGADMAGLLKSHSTSTRKGTALNAIDGALSDRAESILAETIVFDGLGGGVVHPTPHVEDGTTYEEKLLGYGWSAINACLVSEPTYTPTFDELLGAIYENLLYIEISPKVRLIETVSDLEAAKASDQLGIVFGIQSGDAIGRDRKAVRLLHKLGLRILQLTYMERNFIGDGCLEPENRGLTHFGIQVVRDCNRLGLVVDCSHVGIQTTLDAARYSSKPIVISHAACRALADNPRAVTDDQMKAVADGGGIVGITPYAPYIRTDGPATMDDYLRHFDYAIDLIGEDHVGIATDMFDGKTKLNWVTPIYYPEVMRNTTFGSRRVKGFQTKADLGSVVEHFIAHGYSDALIKKILGDNWMRLLGEAWG
ncbi:dipeptidase [Aliihoeflea sp. PC F10.4]